MKRKIFCAILAVVLTFLCTGCRSIPPSVEAVEETFTKNYDNLLTIISYMENSEYDDIQITGCSGSMYADFKWVDITEPAVNAAVNELLGTNIYMHIYKSGNTIRVLQWSSSQNISCGIAYTINGKDLPFYEFMTKIVPLSKEGWYYYVADYNEWRRQQRS